MANIKTEWSRPQPDLAMVKVSQDLNVYTAQQLRSELGDVIQRAHQAGDRVKVLVDLTAVNHLDSTGMGLLIGQLKSARDADCELELAVDNARISRIFAITGLDRIFTIHASVADALEIADQLCMGERDA